MISECGQTLAEGDRFSFGEQTIIADIDVDKIRHDRAQNKTFANAPRHDHFKISSLNIFIKPIEKLSRTFVKHPFVPASIKEFDSRAQEILNIQSTGLARRMISAHTEKLIIGLSGGLDSTLAFLVCLETLKSQAVEQKNLIAVTLPGPGTSEHTLQSVNELTESVDVKVREIKIHAAVEQHLSDIAHSGNTCLLYTSPSPRDQRGSRIPSSA